MGKTKEMQLIIKQYRDTTGETQVDMRKVAKFANDMGWPLSQPADPLDLLAQSFARAARQEIKKDRATGRPYRVNHAIPDSTGQYSLWIDIDEAPRKPMHKSLVNRREQMVGDGLQLTLAARGRSTFSELRRYAPVAAAMATLTPTFGAERPQSV